MQTDRSQPYGEATDKRSLWYGAPGCDDSMRSPDEIRIIRDMTHQEVDTFLTTTTPPIDSAAQKELRNEAPHVQLAVLERGPLRACTNPSGALVARIRDAKRGILDRGRNKGGAAQTPLDPNSSELDKFLADNRVDQAAIASMRCETQEVKNAVMAKGPLVNTTNPSASLMARVRLCKQEVQGGNNVGTPNPPPPAVIPPMMAPPPSLPPGMVNSMPGLEVKPEPLALPAPLPDAAFDGEAMKAIQKFSQQSL